MNGYSSLNQFLNFEEKDFECVTTFMRKKLPTILQRKFKDDAKKLEDELLKFYGSLWMYMPEEFEFVGGVHHTVDSIKNIAASLARKKKSTDFLKVSAVKQTAVPRNKQPAQPNDKSEEAGNDHVLKIKGDLEKLLDKWLATNAPNINGAQAEDPPVTDACIVPDGLDSYYALVPCPVSSCGEKKKLTRHDNRWVTSNFYRHIERLHLLIKKTKVTNQPTLEAMFKQAGPNSTSSKPGSSQTSSHSSRSESTDGGASNDSSRSRSTSPVTREDTRAKRNGIESDSEKEPSEKDFHMERQDK